MNIMLSLDNAFGIFNNLPPRVELSELDLQLPCDPICFETADYQEMVIYSRFPRPKMKVLDAFQKLFMTQSPTSARFDPVEKNALNCWDLLIVIHRKLHLILRVLKFVYLCYLRLIPGGASSLFICLATATFESFGSSTTNLAAFAIGHLGPS